MYRRLIRNNDRTALERLRQRGATLAALLASVLLLTGCGGSGGQTVQADQTRPNGDVGQPAEAAAAQPAAIRIPSGTTMSVRLLSTITSSTAKAGGEFDAELAAPLLVDGQTAFEKGARVRGRVVAAQGSGRLHNPGFLRLTLDAVRDPAGNWERVRTTSISAKGESHKKRNAALIAGGSAVGAAIGAIAGGGKGAAIGAASGAGAGTAGAYATGKKEATFAAERVLRFQTIDEITSSR